MWSYVPPCTLSRHSRESGNPGPQGGAVAPCSCQGQAWAPACARATTILSGSYLTCYRNAAAGTADGPAADDAREHAGLAAGADDHNATGAELVDGPAGERLRPAFGDAPGTGDEIVA